MQSLKILNLNSKLKFLILTFLAPISLLAASDNELQQKLKTLMDKIENPNGEFNAIFGGNLIDNLNKKNRDAKYDSITKLFTEISNFVSYSGSKELPFLIQGIDRVLLNVIDRIVLTNDNENQLSALTKSKFVELIIKPLKAEIASAKKQVDDVYTFREGPRAAKKLLLLLINKMDEVVEKYSQDWQDKLRLWTRNEPGEKVRRS